MGARELEALLKRPAISKVLGDRPVRDIMREMDGAGNGQISFEDFCFAIYGRRIGRTAGPDFYEGRIMEYYSTSYCTWMPCEVTCFDARSGALQLSAKPNYWMSAAEVKNRVRLVVAERGTGAPDAPHRSPWVRKASG